MTAGRLSRDELAAIAKRVTARNTDGSPGLHVATVGRADGLALLAHIRAQDAHIEELNRAIEHAKVGLVPSLQHGFETCNKGDPSPEGRCFVCLGLRATMEARGEVPKLLLARAEPS